MAMPVALPPAPTTQELLTLVSRIPHQPPPLTPVAQLLQPFVSLCNEDWVRDFIFTPDAIELSHLVSPTLPSTAFTCTLSSTRVASPTTVPDPFDTHGDNSHMAGCYLYVPAFNANGATLGFGALDCSASEGDFWASHFNLRTNKCFYTFRFVRDTKKRIQLQVFDIPEDGVVIVFFAVMLSPTRSQSGHSVFLRPSFLKAVHDSEKSLSVDAILPSLLAFQHETQRRCCPFCAASEQTLCVCTIPKTKPAHPFDLGFFAQAMIMSLGDYEGLATKRTFWSGIEHRQVMLGTHVSLHGFVDPATAVKMGSEAMRRLLARQNDDPRLSLMLNAPSSPQLLNQPFVFDQDLLNDTDGCTHDSFNSSGGVESDTIAACCRVSHSLQTGHAGTRADSTRVEDDWWKNRCERQAAEEMRAMAASSAESIGTGASRQARQPGSDTGSRTASDVNEILHKKSSESADAMLIERRKRSAARRERNRAAARRSNQRIKEIREGIVTELKSSREKVEALRAKEILLRQENLELRGVLKEHGRSTTPS